jgi:ABC-type branched-subunit amino acid transport system substrate-binding protein
MKYLYIIFSLSVIFSCSTKKVVKRPPIQNQSNASDKNIIKPNEIKKDSILVNTNISVIQEPSKPKEIQNTNKYLLDKYNISVLLPFNTDDFYVKDSLGNVQKVIQENNKIGLWIYEGMKLAIDEYSTQTTPINFYFFDSNKSNSKVAQVIEDKDFQQSDVIVGPLYNNLLKSVTNWASVRNIPVISPLSASDNITTYENLLQIRPSYYQHALNSLKYLQSIGLQEIIIVHRNNASELQNAQKIYEANKVLNQYFTIHQFVCSSNSLQTSADGTLFENILFQDKSAIIVPSVDENFVSSIVGELTKFKSKIQLIFGNAYWLNFNNYNEKFSNIETLITSPFYIDYKSNEINSFIQTSIKNYGDMPTEYLYLGYDLAKMIIENLLKKGTDFNKISYEGLSTNFNIENIQKNNAFIKKENSFLHVLKIEKENLIKIK